MRPLKKLFSLLACFASLVFFLIHVQNGEAEKLKAYSAEQVRIKGGKTEKVGEIHVAPDKIRLEMRGPNGGGRMIVIVRKDKMVAYTVFPNQKKYVKQLLDEKDLEKRMGQLSKTMKGKEEDLGTETVNGYECEKKRVETSMHIMGREIKTNATIWISDQMDFPLRTENDKGDITEMRNIKPGNQPDSLFEAPEGYKEAANMMEIMAGAMGRGKKAPKTGAQPLPSEMPEKLKELLYGTDNQK